MRKVGFLFLFCAATWSAPYEGKVLKVLAFRDGHTEAVLRELSDFESQTGAKVQLDLRDSHLVAQDSFQDLSGPGTYDLFAVDEPYMPQLSIFFEALNLWPKPSVVQVDSKAQFLEAAQKGGAFMGVPYGLAINGNVYLYAYRKDLFESQVEKARFKEKYQYELKPPETLAQFYDISEFFHRPPTIFGFAPFSRANEGSAVEAFWILKSFGVDLYGELFSYKMDVAKATKAFAFYKKLMSFAPSSATDWDQQERMIHYGSGKVAHMMIWPSLLALLEDPKLSRVVGLTRVALTPMGEGGHRAPVAGTWTLAISKKSKNKKLASEFAYWWGASAATKRFVFAGMNPARRDLLSDSVFQKKYPFFKGVLDNFGVAVTRPRLPKYQEVSEILSKHFVNVLRSKKTPSQAVIELDQELKKVTAF